MRFVYINYTCLPILSLLSLPKDAVREHSASHGKPFYPQRCYPDVNSDINLREEQRNSGLSLPHWEFAWFYPSTIGHREFSMLWGPWNTSLPHRTSFFNNHFYTVQGKSQPHTAQDAVSRETPGSRRSVLGLLSHDTHLSKFFSEDSWLQSGKEHGHPTCEINGECRSRGRAVATPVQCHRACVIKSVSEVSLVFAWGEKEIFLEKRVTPQDSKHITPHVFLGIERIHILYWWTGT